MKLVNLAYKAYVILTELKISLLNAQECKKECERLYPTLKISINDLKNKIDEIENLVEKYCKDEQNEQIDSFERVIEKYIDYIIRNMDEELEILKGSK